MKKNKILLVSILFIALHNINIAAAYENSSGNLNIDSKDIYSIVVTPNKKHGATSYTLKIYSKSNQKKPAISLVHPLNGTISDVNIYDIDKDQKDELVINTVITSSTEKSHYDIFELNGDSLLGRIKQYILSAL